MTLSLRGVVRKRYGITGQFSFINDVLSRAKHDVSESVYRTANGVSLLHLVSALDQPLPTPPPQITGYDRNTLVVTGKNFLPNQTVYVRITASGSVPDGQGGIRSDLRDNYGHMVQLSSDGTGHISGVVDPKTQLQPIVIDALSGETWYGAYPGETVSITAHDGRPGSSFDGHLWSIVYSFTA